MPTALPADVLPPIKARSVTAALWSLNVTKQKPVEVLHTFTCSRARHTSAVKPCPLQATKHDKHAVVLTLPSSPPVTMLCPSGEYASALRA